MCELIDTTISAAVQSSLNNLKSDCEKVKAGLQAAEAADANANSSNSTRRAIKGVLFSVCFLFSLVVPVCIALHKLETVFHLLTELKGDEPESWVSLQPMQASALVRLLDCDVIDDRWYVCRALPWPNR